VWGYLTSSCLRNIHSTQKIDIEADRLSKDRKVTDPFRLGMIQKLFLETTQILQHKLFVVYLKTEVRSRKQRGGCREKEGRERERSYLIVTSQEDTLGLITDADVLSTTKQPFVVNQQSFFSHRTHWLLGCSSSNCETRPREKKAKQEWKNEEEGQRQDERALLTLSN
jgi:hypothetical protein